MKYDILYEGAFAMLKVQLNPGESVKAEMGAMVAMSPNVELRGTVDGGLMRGLGRMLSGEKFFFQELTAVRGQSEVLLSPGRSGISRRLSLTGRTSCTCRKTDFWPAPRAFRSIRRCKIWPGASSPAKAFSLWRSVGAAQSSFLRSGRFMQLIWNPAKR